jgi:hypothetical protein
MHQVPPPIVVNLFVVGAAMPWEMPQLQLDIGVIIVIVILLFGLIRIYFKLSLHNIQVFSSLSSLF